MEIVYSEHLKERLKKRNIPEDYPSKIVNNPEETYEDVVSGYKIYIFSLPHKGSIRKMVVACDRINETLIGVTIYPISEGKLENRRKVSRWI